MTESLSEALAQRLTTALDTAKPKISRSELAKRLKVSAGAVSHWLNGQRTPPDDVVEKIAKLTKTDVGWLLTGESRPQLVSKASATAFTTTELDALEWLFRPAANDFGKDFGNAGVYATPMSAETLVREDGQNSLDVGLDGRVAMRFRIYELDSDTDRYRRFLNALRFDQLSEHILAVATSEFDTKLGTKLAAALERMERHEKLVLVITDDYGALGLQGDEFDSGASYMALVRDNLNSQKPETTAGGIFGVGAMVNQACSGLATVLYASKVVGEEGRGTRVIAKAELPYHEFDEDERFWGVGWLGEVGSQGMATSAWLADGHELLDDLLISRTDVPPELEGHATTGTSIAVVGFLDPKTEPSAGTAQLVDRLARAAAVNFWPAMVNGQLKVSVERYVNDEQVPAARIRVDPTNYVGPFCEAYEKCLVGDLAKSLEESGDVVSVPVTLSVPATKRGAKGIDSHGEVQSECRLIVRLAEADDSDDDAFVNKIGFSRGRAMIVRYVTKNSVVVGARPFHAFVLAGTLVGDSPEEVAAEQFLRLAEPPAHNRWEFNEDLREKYTRGSGTRLNEFHAQIIEALQQVLRPAPREEEEGPEVLRRLLQLREPAPRPRPVAKLHRATGTIVDGAWSVDAEVALNPSAKTAEITPTLAFEREGSAGVPVKWAFLEVTEGSTVHLDGHRFVAKPRTKRFKFHGVSDPSTHPVAADDAVVGLDVHGKLRQEDE